MLDHRAYVKQLSLPTSQCMQPLKYTHPTVPDKIRLHLSVSRAFRCSSVIDLVTCCAPHADIQYARDNQSLKWGSLGSVCQLHALTYRTSARYNAERLLRSLISYIWSSCSNNLKPGSAARQLYGIAYRLHYKYMHAISDSVCCCINWSI